MTTTTTEFKDGHFYEIGCKDETFRYPQIYHCRHFDGEVCLGWVDPSGEVDQYSPITNFVFDGLSIIEQVK